MKKLINFKSKNNNKLIAISAALTAFFMENYAYANATVLTKAEKTLTALETDLNVIIPIAAAVILLCLAIGYAGRYIGKDTFVRWSVGVVVAG
uniref:VirB2 family type IV secretion system major pilin TrwL n=1 Tax=Bartonella raoultii TaxID=1457020 RepID=UPI001ABAF958